MAEFKWVLLWLNRICINFRSIAIEDNLIKPSHLTFKKVICGTCPLYREWTVGPLSSATCAPKAMFMQFAGYVQTCKLQLNGLTVHFYTMDVSVVPLGIHLSCLYEVFSCLKGTIICSYRYMMFPPSLPSPHMPNDQSLKTFNFEQKSL